jgi:catechol 2,3-dioxygenase-like lactoylglutathione lyase family enzyme
VIVGSTLERLVDAFEDIGLEAEYAGPLANDVNHLSQLAFPDGSYFELLSTIEPDQESPWWNDHLKRDGGPCAFAIESSDIVADTERVQAAEIPVDGPTEYGRERPNGTYFEYELSIVGEGGVARKYPFLIQEHTPRSKRVEWPSPTVAQTALTGIAYVVIGVSDLEASSNTYRAAYGLDEPIEEPMPALGATAYRFPESPIVLATPTDEDTLLAERIEHHGERPAAFLLGTDSFSESSDRFDLDMAEQLFGYECGWLANYSLEKIEVRIGILGD